jgi:phosphatidate cytidylyltransferase
VLRHRLILGPIFVLFLIAGLWLDEVLDQTPSPEWLASWLPLGETLPPGIVIFAATIVLALLAASELARILSVNGITTSAWATCVAALAGLLASTLTPSGAQGVTGSAVISSVAAGVLVASLVYYSRRKSVEGIVASAGGTLLSFVYLGVLFGFFVFIRREHSAWVVLWVLLVTKSCDIGAFFTGRSIGRHKLIPWVSPGKTWEGLIGGVITSAAVAAVGMVALQAWVDESSLPGPWLAAVAGATFGLIGQAGDLVASLFKRDAGIKDASSILPGFGGVMDVVDSPLLVAPAAYWWLAAQGT